MAPILGLSAIFWLGGLVLARFGSEAATRIKADAPRRKAIRRRKAIIGQALSDLAKICVRGFPENPQTFNRIQEHVLEAICSHTSHQVRAPEGALAANLMILDGEYLEVVARHGGGRPTPVRYHRTTLFCAEAIEKRKTISVGDVRRWRGPIRPTSVTYRDILALPILGTADGEMLGVVTVDSERPYDFNRKEQLLGIGLSPYANLLKVLILLDRRMGSTSGGRDAERAQQARNDDR